MRTTHAPKAVLLATLLGLLMPLSADAANNAWDIGLGAEVAQQAVMQLLRHWPPKELTCS